MSASLVQYCCMSPLLFSDANCIFWLLWVNVGFPDRLQTFGKGSRHPKAWWTEVNSFTFVKFKKYNQDMFGIRSQVLHNAHQNMKYIVIISWAM